MAEPKTLRDLAGTEVLYSPEMMVLLAFAAGQRRGRAEGAAACDAIAERGALFTHSKTVGPSRRCAEAIRALPPPGPTLDEVIE